MTSPGLLGKMVTLLSISGNVHLMISSLAIFGVTLR